MSKPFHFPTEYGKMGQWPGSLGPNEAQAILLHAVNVKPGGKFVELGFDGGRATIVLNWAARDLGASIDVLPVMQDESGLWFQRASILFRFERRVRAHEKLEPFPADLIVMNPVVPSAPAWTEIANPGAIVIKVGAFLDKEPVEPHYKVVLNQPGLVILQNTGAGHVVERAIESVVGEFTKKGPDNGDLRAKIRSLREDKKRPRARDGADSKLHAVMDADKGPELQSS